MSDAMQRLGVVALAVALAGGCAPQVTPQIASPIAASQNKVAAPQNKSRAGKRARLGWVAWQDASSILYCNRRVDDAGGSVGVLGPCWQLAIGGEPKKLVSWLNSEQPDPSNSDAAPSDACAVEQQDAQLPPDAKPARAWLAGKTTRALLDEWTPDHAKLTADAYSIEPSFSPDGKNVALLHLAVGLGEGTRTIEIAGAQIKPVPECK